MPRTTHGWTSWWCWHPCSSQTKVKLVIVGFLQQPWHSCPWGSILWIPKGSWPISARSIAKDHFITQMLSTWPMSWVSSIKQLWSWIASREMYSLEAFAATRGMPNGQLLSKHSKPLPPWLRWFCFHKSRKQEALQTRHQGRNRWQAAAPYKRDICKFFAQGFCSRGDACTYIHEASVEASESETVI